MRLLLASMAALAACGSSGHGRAPAGGAGGGPGRGMGLSPDTSDAQVIDGGAADAVDAALTYSCQVAAEAGGLAACIELDPGNAATSAPCEVSDAGPITIGPCPRDGLAGGCHVVEDAATGYTIWWYAPLGTGAVLSRCEQQGDSYVSP